MNREKILRHFIGLLILYVLLAVGLVYLECRWEGIAKAQDELTARVNRLETRLNGGAHQSPRP